MVEIRFYAHFGFELKFVNISSVPGAGDQYHVYIDKLFYGSLVYLNNEWVLHSNRPELLTADDIQILGDIIDNKKSAQVSGF